MRLLVLPVLLLAACAQQPSPRTAAEFLALYQPTFAQPAPRTVVTGLDLPLRPGDRILANCAKFFADEIGELEPEDLRAFEQTVTCIYPPKGEFDTSASHYARAIAGRGFQNDSGTYVQSGINLMCNRTHTIAMKVMSKFVPRSYMDAKGEDIDIEGGGDLGHMTIMFTAAEEPCERYKAAAGFSEAPAPQNYSAQPQPNFIPADIARMRWGDYELALRPGDRLVAHCGQYYREEIGGNLPKDAIPEEFAQYNQTIHCIYPAGGNMPAATAHYLSTLEAAGYTQTPQMSLPRPDADARFPSLRAGQQEWYGRISRCGADNRSVWLGGLARHGAANMLDPLTGEYFEKRDPSGGRARKLEGASFPNPILLVRLGSFGC